MSRTALFAATTLCLALLAACGSTGGAQTAATTTPASAAAATTPPLTGSITVLAASSLTESFNEIGRRFKAAHPGVDVTFSFDASSTLVQQVSAGAPADVLATADDATMQKAVDAHAVATPTILAHNQLAIIVAKGNPKNVRGLADLAQSGLVLVLSAAEVPCGKFAAQALTNAGVQVQPRSLEPNVKAVVSKVTLGEADAGIVYSTDVNAAGNTAQGVPIPATQNVVATYPIATLQSPRNPAVAAAFVAFVRSDEGRSVLAAAGFVP